LLTGIEGVEVRGRVIAPEHPDDYPEEPGNLRHGPTRVAGLGKCPPAFSP
jgi:hypothetical protein